MRPLSIPTIEKLQGFERIDVLALTADHMTFCIVGSTLEFGATAADLFQTHGLVAMLGDLSGHLFQTEVTKVVGAPYVTVTSSLPR